jgi:hypothetical protein
MAKYQLRLKERRISERKRLTGLMPGRFLVNGKALDAKPIDISSHGLGLIMSEQIKEGTTATLTISGRDIPLEVKWILPDFGKHDLWRYGLVCTSMDVDLISEFTAAGCLK